MEFSDKYLSYTGKAPNRIPHWEHWSHPDAETYLTGIDYYEHPRLCRQKLMGIYPQLGLTIPETDAPKSRPKLGTDGVSSNPDTHTVRWGDSETGTWEHGEAYFHSIEEVFAFSPLKKSDFSAWRHVVVNWDFSSEEAIYQKLRKNYPEEWGDQLLKAL